MADSSILTDCRVAAEPFAGFYTELATRNYCIKKPERLERPGFHFC